MNTKVEEALRLKRLKIDTGKNAVVFTHYNNHLCKLKGFSSQDRIDVSMESDKTRSISATLNMVKDDHLLAKNEASLSEYAWKLLGVKEGQNIHLSHPKPIESMGYIRGKLFGKSFTDAQLAEIMQDIVDSKLSEAHISAFLTVCESHMSIAETIGLTKAMVNVGRRIDWKASLVVDKHCVGGLPGNRTTPIVISIVAAFGLTIPKTSSRAITSCAGTADTVETMMPVELSFEQMQKVVEKEGGCMLWGGSVSLSPADDVLIRVERQLDLDSQAQLVASVLSKKIAAGSTHVLLDIPMGPTAKVRNKEEAEKLKKLLEDVGKAMGLVIKVVFTDGSRPVGRGIGPALEAQDVIAVLQNKPDAPSDLRERSIALAADILEFSPNVKKGEGRKFAENILSNGEAWKKFQAIAKAQGGFHVPSVADYRYDFRAAKDGVITLIDNRRIARLAKFAGAPMAAAAGVYLYANVDSKIKKDDPIFAIHAESQGELDYAIAYLNRNADMITIG